MDNWKDKSSFKCETCMYYVEKDLNIGRCRRHAPLADGGGWPVVYATDFCGDHKLDAGHNVKKSGPGVKYDYGHTTTGELKA